MFHILIDTCVWLDIAKDRKQQTLLTALERLIEHEKIKLIVPQQVIDEFGRNKARIVKDSTQSISTTIRRARELVEQLSKGAKRRAAIEQLNDVDHLLPTLGDAAVESVVRIEALFGASNIVQTSDRVKICAAQRGLEKKAPFHRPRNGMADSILIEIYAEIIRASMGNGERFAFVTHNIHDFSQSGGDERLPHPDIAAAFSKIKSLYSTNLAQILKRIDPKLLLELRLDNDFSFEPRAGSEIAEAAEELVQKIWYDRHQQWRQRVADGVDRIVPDSEGGQYSPRATPKSIWDGARKAAAKVEKKYGKKNLGPWSKFDWGMMNGKLSALRWCLGEEWDMLDT